MMITITMKSYDDDEDDDKTASARKKLIFRF